jgi:hypothetical protein
MKALACILSFYQSIAMEGFVYQNYICAVAAARSYSFRISSLHQTRLREELIYSSFSFVSEIKNLD